jgi:hypothetical protein
MQVTYATEAAPGCANEDVAVCGDGWALVLDGATAPPGVDSGCIHDVRWLVHRLAAALSQRLIRSGGALPVLLAEAITETCDAHAATCDLANPDSPSSTVAVTRTRGSVLDYLVLGDSPVVIRSPGEGLTVISDDRLAHLPGGRPYSRELVRTLRNKPDGFWVASTSPDVAYQAVAGSLPSAAGAEVGLFTDGVSRLVEFYGYDWEGIFWVLETSGPGALISLVRSLERDRPIGCGKRHDDATAVFATNADAEASAQRPASWRSLIGM